jgi:hypothetical protein
MTVSFYYSVYPLSLCDKKGGVIFIFGPGMYFQTGQVIFVPEWPKGEFVIILASFCVWTKSLICKDAANRDSTVQSEVRRISKFPVSRPDDVSSRLDAYLSTIPSVRTSDRQASSVRTTCFFHPDTYIVSRSFCTSLLRPDVSAARPDAYQFSNGLLIISKFQERED